MPIRIRIRIRTLIRDPDRHQNLTICSLARQPYLKISCKSVWTFLRKVADRQSGKKTDRQTTTKTTSLAEVKITIALSRTLALSHFWTVIATNNHETHVKQSTDCTVSGWHCLCLLLCAFPILTFSVHSLDDNVSNFNTCVTPPATTNIENKIYTAWEQLWEAAVSAQHYYMGSTRVLT